MTAAATIRTQVTVPISFGDGFATTARLYSFNGLADDREHVAFGLGSAAHGHLRDVHDTPLVRLHSECLTGDTFGSRRCDCGPQLREAVEQIALTGGYLLYLRQEGRGIGLYNKIDAYALQDGGLDTYEANVALGHRPDERDYTAAAQMLRALGSSRIVLLSNNPDKLAQLNALGVDVVEQRPTRVHRNSSNTRYLETKARRGGHILDNLSQADRDHAIPDRDGAEAHIGSVAGSERFCSRVPG